jgi:hypothetical protein
MNKFFEKYAKLRELYPGPVEEIQDEVQRVSALLQKQDYYKNPETQQLVSLCRTDIVSTRMMLTTERNLPDEARAELWHIIDGRLCFLQIVSRDFDN